MRQTPPLAGGDRHEMREREDTVYRREEIVSLAVALAHVDRDLFARELLGRTAAAPPDVGQGLEPSAMLSSLPEVRLLLRRFMKRSTDYCTNRR